MLTIRRQALAVLLPALALAACGAPAPTPPPATTSTPASTLTTPASVGPTTSTLPAEAPTPHALIPVQPGAAGTPQRVLYDFALAYGNSSAATVVAQQATMASLATPEYAAKLQAAAPQARLEAVRALPAGAAAVARVISLDVPPPPNPTVGHTQIGVVILATTIVPSPTANNPTPQTFTALLKRLPQGWRVADFQPGLP